MRTLCTSLAAALSLATCATLAHADTVPSGGYTLAATTYTSGVHQTPPAVITGSLFFAPDGTLTSASLILTDLTSGLTTTYTSVGTTEFEAPYHLQSTLIYNALNHALYYDLAFAEIPNVLGAYTDLTCGTDCHDFAVTANNGYYEFHGAVTPAPEPSTLALLGTGALSALGVARRRLTR